MRCDELKNIYLKGLGESISLEPVPEGCIIHTPHMDPSNDLIELLIEDKGDMFRVSDMTQAMEYLFLHGINVKKHDLRPKYYLEQNLERFEINLFDDELYVEVPKAELSDGITRLIEAIISIDDIAYTIRLRGASDFREKVAEWLTENEILYERDVPIEGKNKEAKIHFVVERDNKAPIFLNALHSENAQNAKEIAYNTIMDFWELSKKKIPFVAACILDDEVEDNVWKYQYPILKDGIGDYVIYWSEKEDILPILAQ